MISLELKYHLILVLKARAVQISSQIKFAYSYLLLDLGLHSSLTHLCCQQNGLVWFISAFRRKKARDKNGKKVPCYTSYFTSSQTDM